MPAFCYLRHEPSSDVGRVLDRMGDALVPAELDAQGSLRRIVTPGGTLIFWDAAHVPRDLHQAPDGGVALLMGEAIAPDTSRRFTAADLYARPALMEDASGVFGWLRVQPDGAVLAGGDPFGVFPLYYFHSGNSLTVGTSIAAFRAHPAYDRRIDLVGMFRILIENGCSGTRTLERGATRLDAGQILKVGCGGAPPERLDRPVAWHSSQPKITDMEEAVELSVRMSEQACHRHTNGTVDHLLLSGGLDSRHLAALVHRTGLRPRCYTFGQPTDLEATIARRVARRIQCRWSAVPDEFPSPSTVARAELETLSLAGGFSSVTFRALEAVGRSGAQRVLSGLCLDAMYSPMLRTQNPHPVGSFEYCLGTWINRVGVPVETLLRLARPGEPRDSLEEALREIRRAWDAFPGDQTDRLWRTILQHRLRPHLGGYIWKCSFYTWLVLPALDVPLVRALRTVSGELLRKRELQRQTVVHLSRTLASIPLDNMTDQPESILPGRWNAWHHRRFLARLRRNGLTPADAHRFPRITTMKHPVWQGLRQLAEPGRPALEEWLAPEVLKGCLPPALPAKKNKPPAAIAGTGGQRLLLGLMIWLQSR